MQLFFIFTVILFVLYALLLIYYRAAWVKIPVQSSGKVEKANHTSMVVIIPARNEAHHLPALLHALSLQSIDKKLVDIIVVDDHSTDNTAEIVQQYPPGNVRLIQLKDFLPATGITAYKKMAIETAIAQSKGELIITTDADCTVPENWLATIAAFYEQYAPACIVMPVVYSNRNNFLEIFQALDFMTLQGITGAAVSGNKHSMCNGANLAYTRKAFEAVNGFEGINQIASGDDMLLLHKIFKKFPEGIRYLKSREVIVSTAPMHSWKDFLNQRIRWASKADKYDDKRIFPVLLTVYLLNAVLMVMPFFSLAYQQPVSIFNVQVLLINAWLFLLLFKTIIELIFLYPVARFFGKEKLLWLFPLAQPFHILYTVMAGWLGKFGSYQWKERKVK